MASIYLDKRTMATTVCTDCTMIFIAFIGQAGTLTFIIFSVWYILFQQEEEVQIIKLVCKYSSLVGY